MLPRCDRDRTASPLAILPDLAMRDRMVLPQSHLSRLLITHDRAAMCCDLAARC
jgi:hypothetical protein